MTGAVLLAPAVRAQSLQLPNHWMDWHILPVSRSARCRADKVAEADMVRSLQRILLAVASAHPPLPPNTYVEPAVIATSEPACERAPLSGNASVAVWDDSQMLPASKGADQATLKPHHSESGGAISLVVNRLPATVDVDFIGENGNPMGITLYQQTSAFQGYPVLQHRLIVITPAGHGPLYIPVPFELALKIAIAYHEKLYADELQTMKDDAAHYSDTSDWMKGMKAAGVSRQQLQDLQATTSKMVTARVESARTELELLQGRQAKLNAADRPAPTYVTRATSNSYIPQAGPGAGAEPLMMPNPDYFNPRLARSVPQFIVINMPYWIDEAGRPDASWQWNAVQNINWSALAVAALN